MHKFNAAIFLLFFLSLSVFAQSKFTLSGTVFDHSNVPLPGASVYINGTNIGTSADRNGNFSLVGVDVGEHSLRTSFTGYKKYSKLVNITGNQTDLSIVLEATTGELGEIVITGTGTPHHIKHAPVPTELYSSKEIERIAAPDLRGLLSTVSPSIDFSPTGMGQNLQINGLGNDFITILVDGRRMSGDIGGQSELNRINMADIERIEVVKGASSSLYGSDAIGGVINIITKQPKDKIGFVNDSYVGGYGVFNQNNTLSFNTGKLSGKTHVAYQKNDGWQNSPYELDDDELIPTTQMTQNAYNSISVDQSLSYNVTKKLSLTGFVSLFSKELFKIPEHTKYDYIYDDLTYNIGAKYLLNETDRIEADFHSDKFTYTYRYNQHDTIDNTIYPKDTLVEQNQQIRDAFNVRYINRLSDDNVLTLGSEYVNQRYISEGRVEGGEANTYTASLYAQDEHQFFDALDVVVGARLVYNEEFGAVVTPKVSAMYRLSDFNFRATYSKGFKSPTLKQLYICYQKGSTLCLGNTDMKPQTSNYYNTGVDYHNHFMSLNVAAYINQVDNLIEYVTIETTPEDAEEGVSKTKQYYNIEEAQTKGIDVNFKIFMPLGFSMGAGYSYVDAMNLTSNERLEYVSKNHFTANVNYNHAWPKYDLNVLFTVRAQDEKYFDDGPAPAYQLFKLATTHKFATMGIVNLTATAGIDNIFNYIDDTPYSGNRGTINPGRTYYAGLLIELAN